MCVCTCVHVCVRVCVCEVLKNDTGGLGTVKCVSC